MAVAWAALGILTAFSLGVLGIFVSLLGRFDRINDKFDRIDDRFERIDARFDRVDDKFDGMNVRIDGLSGRIDRSDSAHEEITGEIRALGDRLERRIDEHYARYHAG